MPANPPKQIGKYQLTDVLGEGAMGVVYRAFDPVLNRYLAIKVMNAVIASDAMLRDRFLREARAAGSLQHPNVITIFDFGEADDHLFIAMEYVEGVDLAELIERRDPMPIVNKIDIIIDTLNGLGYAHSRGVVHRDIKPANIRVTTDGRAKLMDFGIARLQSSEMTRSGEMLGTPQYMAPEQVTGGEITPAADIFSMGAVLYELLTYTKAFAGDTLHVVLYNITTTEPPSVRTLVQGVPVAVESIIKKAMAKESGERYANAPAMIQALRIARQELSGPGERPTVKVRPSTRTLAATAIPQRRQLRRAGVIGGLVAAAAVGVLWLGPWRASPAAAPAAPVTPTQVAEEQPSQAATVTTPPPAAKAPSASRATEARAKPTVTATDARRLEAPPSAPPRAGSTAAGQDTASPPRGQATVPVNPVPPAPVAPSPAAPPPAAQAAQRPSAPAAVAPPSVESAATVDPRPDIERMVGLYGHAIESANIAEIKRVYAGLTAPQQQAWEGFFRSVKNLKARLSVDRLSVAGATADAGISAVYEYENKTTGQSVRQDLHLQATLNRDAGGWHIATIR